MSLRRLLPTLLVLAVTAVPAAAAVAEDNQVTAVNETDGAQIFQLSIDLQRITEGPVVDQNIAQTYASCEDCRTIAIAVQVLLLMDDIRQVVPVNLAESINYECTRCESLAYAGQLVLSTGGKVRLTGEARRRIGQIEDALNALQDSDATLLEIYAEVDRLVDDLKLTVAAGLVPVGNQHDRQAPGDVGDDRDGDPVTGTAGEDSGGTGSGDEAQEAIPAQEPSGDAGDLITGDADAEQAIEPATGEGAPSTTTDDLAPTPDVTTPTTTTTADPAPAGTPTTSAPAPADTAGGEDAATSTATEPAPTSEPAPTTTTTEPAPAGTTATEPAPEAPAVP